MEDGSEASSINDRMMDTNEAQSFMRGSKGKSVKFASTTKSTNKKEKLR